MILYLLLLCFLFLVISVYVNINLYRKYQAVESAAIENEQFIFSMRNRVLQKQSELKAIDHRGSFEADDEVGFIFKEIQRIVHDIAVFLDLQENENTESPTSPYQNSILSNRLKRGATIRNGEN